jgi:hypothetical protein
MAAAHELAFQWITEVTIVYRKDSEAFLVTCPFAFYYNGIRDGYPPG